MSITAVQPSAQNNISIPTETLEKRETWWETRITVGGQTLRLTAPLPFHGYFPFARLSGAHVVKAASVVVGVGATEHQLAPWEMFWIPENSY